jgi:hypothetical protein
MPNIDPTRNNIQETVITNGEITGEPIGKKPSFLGKIGNILGTAAKIGVGVVTGGGIGGVLPGLLGNSGSLVGQLEQLQQDNVRSQTKLIMFQNKVQRAGEEFAAISNLLKTRHDSEMQAVNNMKS